MKKAFSPEELFGHSLLLGDTMSNNAILYALIATTGTWLITALGAATVIFFKKTNEGLLNLMLGFAAGVMLAASYWSLLEPAIERAEECFRAPAWLIVTVSFICGAVFMWVCDKAVSRARRGLAVKGQEKTNRIIMLVLSITLHNIPEGLAVGVAFGALQGNPTREALMGAITIAVGIGLQNLPEGAAVSLPLKREGFSEKRSFLIGQASALVEPIAGVTGAASVIFMKNVLPFALAFAAGAMILVAVHELIPECQQGKKTTPYLATMGIIAGFSVMMLLDVALG